MNFINNNMVTTRQPGEIEKEVQTRVWRDSFLHEISRIDNFEEWLSSSLSAVANQTPGQEMNHLTNEALKIVQSKDRNELTAARQYYNNAHLLGYWRMLNTELGSAIKRGAVDADFPLLKIQPDKHPNWFLLTGIPLQFFSQIKFDIDEQTVLTSPEDFKKEVPVLLKPSGGDQTRQSRLNMVFLQLSLLVRIQMEAMSTFYKLFLQFQYELKSPLWDYYKIHIFLDNFLYVREDGYVRRSNFGNIFGNSSLYELKLYLQSCLDSHIKIRLADVEGFLKRQRKYMLNLALTISLEENEIHNCRKDLLAYDPERGVVRAIGITKDMLDYYQQSVIAPLGVIKQNGCPFALSKGLSRNALIENFEHFDRLIISFLRNSKNFHTAFIRIR